MNLDRFEWDLASISQLEKDWKDGLPASDIALRLHVSKNAVVGKAHRLGLPSRGSPLSHNFWTKERRKAAGEKAARTRSAKEMLP